VTALLDGMLERGQRLEARDVRHRTAVREEPCCQRHRECLAAEVVHGLLQLLVLAAHSLDAQERAAREALDAIEVVLDDCRLAHVHEIGQPLARCHDAQAWVPLGKDLEEPIRTGRSTWSTCWPKC